MVSLLPSTDTVVINSSLPAVLVGSSYSVNCTVNLDERVVDLRLIWIDSQGNVRESTNNFTTTATGGTKANLELLLDPILLSDAGLYTCNVTILENREGTFIMSEQHTVDVQGIMTNVYMKLLESAHSAFQAAYKYIPATIVV